MRSLLLALSAIGIAVAAVVLRRRRARTAASEEVYSSDAMVRVGPVPAESDTASDE